ncbi:GNAT family N-acetyltransferase [Microbacterium sp. RURRCA19A]|uniref:GNAT family N-acetyltransferase n=1 Tax=Microbacterium sp. RURRCA19A TaxID=1907391 RepID=UPI0034C5D4A7
MRWIQAECEELFIQSVTENARQIANRLVFLAEVDDCPVGLCVSSVGRYNSEHLFIQRVGVVPPARRRGAGIALLSAAANEVPGMNIAGATAAGDEPAHALNRKLALRLSGNISNLRRGAFAPTDLGIVRGEPHIPWVIDRSPREVDGRSAR